MDVYFERIAGVAEPKGQGPRRPAGATPAPKSGASRLELDGDEAESHGPEPVALDENGFPLSPLRDQDELWFVQAAQLYRPLDKCAATARASGGILMTSGVLTLFFAAISAAFGGLQENLVTFVVGLILITLGLIERSAGQDVALCKVSAPSRLAWNQLMLFGIIALSCGMQMKTYQGEQAAAALTPEMQQQLAESNPELAGMMANLQSIGPTVVYTFFGFIVLTSLMFQGGMALYYLSRRRRIQRFHQELPPWVSRIVLTVAQG